MEQIITSLNKLGIKFGRFKSIYINEYITNETIICHEQLHGKGFSIYCLTFGDKSKEYGLTIESLGMLEGTDVDRIIKELEDYFC